MTVGEVLTVGLAATILLAPSSRIATGSKQPAGTSSFRLNTSGRQPAPMGGVANRSAHGHRDFGPYPRFPPRRKDQSPSAEKRTERKPRQR
jgi:hypothetical protein